MMKSTKIYLCVALIILSLFSKAQNSFSHFENGQCTSIIDTVANKFIRVRRVVPFISISHDRQDTIFWKNDYPDKYLSDCKILSIDSNGTTLLALHNDTFEVSLGSPTLEMYYEPIYRNYRDTVGNCYLNVFCFVDTPENYLHLELLFYGLFDMNGRLVQPLIFDVIPEFEAMQFGQDEIFPFVYKSKIGFMDSSARIIIQPIYDDPEVRDYKWDYTSEGDKVETNAFFDNYCKVIKNRRIGVIDNKGNSILACNYKKISYIIKYSLS